MRDNGQAHAVASFEELRLAIEGQVLQLFLGINRLPNLFLSQCFQVHVPAGSKVSTASLQIPFLFACQRDLQMVVFPVEFQVLRRETQNIRNFRFLRGLQESLVNIVAIVEEGSASAIG